MATETKDLLTAEKLEQMVAEIDSGGRAPHGSIPKAVLFFVPLLWSLFQLWYSSPLPFLLDFFVINDTQARSIHLAFAMFLAYTAFPTFKSSPRKYIPIQDWVLALIAAYAAAYIYLSYAALSTRPGSPITFDLIVSAVGIILLLEATRRALGPPLMVIGTLFIIYAFAGPYMPDVIAHKGASLIKGMSHYWLSTEGVFGVALGVSTGMVFMFVLFGSLLEKAGAGNYFIKVAFAGLGHMRGGPAKAAVVSSAMTGMISGSSIANVVTTGTFTIPLMKKVGFTAGKSRRHRMRLVGQRPDHPAGHGRRRLPDGRIRRRTVYRDHQARRPAGLHRLRRPALHRPPRGLQDGAAGTAEKAQKDAGPVTARYRRGPARGDPDRCRHLLRPGLDQDRSRGRGSIRRRRPGHCGLSQLSSMSPAGCRNSRSPPI